MHHPSLPTCSNIVRSNRLGSAIRQCETARCRHAWQVASLLSIRLQTPSRVLYHVRHPPDTTHRGGCTYVRTHVCGIPQCRRPPARPPSLSGSEETSNRSGVGEADAAAPHCSGFDGRHEGGCYVALPHPYAHRSAVKYMYRCASPHDTYCRYILTPPAPVLRRAAVWPLRSVLGTSGHPPPPPPGLNICSYVSIPPLPSTVAHRPPARALRSPPSASPLLAGRRFTSAGSLSRSLLPSAAGGCSAARSRAGSRPAAIGGWSAGWLPACLPACLPVWRWRMGMESAACRIQCGPTTQPSISLYLARGACPMAPQRRRNWRGRGRICSLFPVSAIRPLLPNLTRHPLALAHAARGGTSGGPVVDCYS